MIRCPHHRAPQWPILWRREVEGGEGRQEGRDRAADATGGGIRGRFGLAVRHGGDTEGETSPPGSRASKTLRYADDQPGERRRDLRADRCPAPLLRVAGCAAARRRWGVGDDLGYATPRHGDRSHCRGRRGATHGDRRFGLGCARQPQFGPAHVPRLRRRVPSGPPTAARGCLGLHRGGAAHLRRRAVPCHSGTMR